VTLVEVADVEKAFAGRGGALLGGVERRVAVDHVSLAVEAGETLGIVGESGSGKSTLARMIAGLLHPDAGQVRVAGLDPALRHGAAARRLAQMLQMVFQDPYSSLNPRLTVGASVMEPLTSGLGLSRGEARARALAMLEKVGVPADAFARYPHQFSGGQRQRICIARALAPRPKLVILDEAVSSLDVSVKSQILNLLSDLQADLHATFVFISHDLAITRQFCRRLAVMLRGRIVETGPSEAVLRAPAHPYTRLLIASIPRRGGALAVPEPVQGQPAGAGGCRFAERCPQAMPRCRTVRPEPVEIGAGRWVACHAPGG
jgi:oligopeptide/dipeptide ABC transporter ATP-binding protein